MQFELIKASPTVPLTGPSDAWLSPLAANMAANLLADGILTGGQVYYDAANTRISVPRTGSISLKDGSTFTSTIVPTGGKTGLVLKVTGQVAQGSTVLAQRSIWLTLNANPEIPIDTEGFAMVAKGTITLPSNPNAGVYGYDSDAKAATNLKGRVYTPWGPGNGSIVALQDPKDPPLVFDPNFPPLHIPEVDVSFLAGLKGSTLSQFVAPKGNKAATLTNTYIPAGTNPTIGQDVTINGILYVEWPNNLSFTSKNVTLNGVIVYQRKPPGNIGTSDISLDKSTTVTNSGQQSASQLASVAGLNQQQIASLTGWSILAPDTDLTLANGNAATKAFGGALHVNNVIQETGQGGAASALTLNKANIICEGNADFGGNRVLWIKPPGNLANGSSLGINNYLYGVNNAYYEP
jgi:hypothetical protein